MRGEVAAILYRHKSSLFDLAAGAEHSSALQWIFVDLLDPLRTEMGFLLVGWVLMPDHFHFLVKPEPAENPSRAMQELKKRTAQYILAPLSASQHLPWCGKMLACLLRPAKGHGFIRAESRPTSEIPWALAPAATNPNA